MSLMDGVNVNVNKFRIKGKTTTMEEEIKVSNRRAHSPRIQNFTSSFHGFSPNNSCKKNCY